MQYRRGSLGSCEGGIDWPHVESIDDAEWIEETPESCPAQNVSSEVRCGAGRALRDGWFFTLAD